MIKTSIIQPHNLQFKFKAGTSRGSLTQKNTWFWILEDENGNKGIGECGPLKGLSIDDLPDFEEILTKYANQLIGEKLPNSLEEIFLFVSKKIDAQFPSIRFGLETALLDLLNGGQKKIFDTPFFEGKERIPINGLVWMGDREFMFQQIKNKLDQGFDTIKMKIGAIDFDTECELLAYIRSQFSADQITLRVDANGAFHPKKVMEKLRKLEKFQIHSIEQPIMAGQHEEMFELCQKTPVPIALDEELIGVHANRKDLLKNITPQFIILKPTLVGGVAAIIEWINYASDLGIAWWMTSALESNIGLNAISQLSSYLKVQIPQGLGTGQLYHNNIQSPLTISNGQIFYVPENEWGAV